jgi:hypothetical protein
MHRSAWVTLSERRWQQSDGPTASPSNARSPPGETMLANARCPACGWIGTTDADVCPCCEYGLIEYTLRLVDG